MAQRLEFLKGELVDQVLRLVDERLAADEAAMAARLVRLFYDNVAPEDMAHRDPDSLYGAAISLLGLARHRDPAKPAMRVFNPSPQEHGWQSPHTVIEIVNDDMPFLVDSTTAALANLDLAVHLVIHPIVGAVRDAQGRLLDIVEPGTEGCRLESLMYVEIDRQSTLGAEQRILDRLATVLAEVRAAVEGWRPMGDRVMAVLAGLDTPPAGLTDDEVAEARDFLRWLHDDHFTFLGYRSFTFAAAGSGAIAADADSGLGIMRLPDVRVFEEWRDLAAMPPEVTDFLRQKNLLLISKTDRAATVHRPVPMDIVVVKKFDEAGTVTGLHSFIGLFASVAYTRSPKLIPVLRRKVANVIRRAGFRPSSHDGKALLNILEGYPRDELFQIGEDALLGTALGILRLQERQRIAVFLRKDEFERFLSCLVYVPRDRYDTTLRLAVQRILEQSFNGELGAYYTQVGDSPLARLHFILRTRPGHIPDVPVADIEARLADAARSWGDRLQEALTIAHGEEKGLALYRRLGSGFPSSYREHHSAQVAVFDLDRIAEVMVGGVAMNLYHPAEVAGNEARLKLYHAHHPVPLSDVLPVLEHMGFRVISEMPHQIRLEGGGTAWLHDFIMRTSTGAAVDVGDLRERFQDVFLRVWDGDAEDDGFNRLVLLAGLGWRDVVILRAYAKYLRQAGITFSQSYIERALAGNPAVVESLVRLFRSRFDPKANPDAEAAARIALDKALDAVVSADDDRILRRFHNLVLATLRTNFFQPGADGRPKPYLSFKLDSRAVDDLPLPTPWVETFVYSPRVEAVHLRGGRVARGGIRWSDRREDFRTEILGLMKAQMVKNAVIIPMGAKGGFVVKRPPAEGGREALQAEGIACYSMMIRGLLDLTDTLRAGVVVPPPDVVRRDGDDPYLVVAADKGTATFSDTANAISLDYGFWLGDAFASGGSQGYDHKGMGITARGAWEAVKRHFRELGHDVQNHDFTVVGVGDMSGDVFGNGMLCSPHIRLVAAFNHAHIFVDPDPDATTSYGERLRLFKAVKAWGDYDSSLISDGGGVFARSAKTITITPQMAERFGITKAHLTPAELIRTLLTTRVDLLFFGGIGTYIKAHDESHAEVGDRANEAVRVDGAQVRATVVGEGANLGVTQRGRIEMAQNGIRLNTDAIDNSAGVDTSDHEVNIKILLGEVVAAGDMTEKQRDQLLASMTDEVAQLVLRDNYLQTQALSLMEAGGADLLDGQTRFMRLLEKAGRLDRAIEFLPDDETLTDRAAKRRGLTRPELSVLLAYAKIWLHDAVMASSLPDDPFLAADLGRYFPSALRDRFAAQIGNHRLRREIVATSITNSMINRVGIGFVLDMMDRTGFGAGEVARAYIVARDAYGLRDLWRQIEELDGLVPAGLQTVLLNEANRLMERATAWVLRSLPADMDMSTAIAGLAPGITALEQACPDILPEEAQQTIVARAQDYVAQGAPNALADKVARMIVLASAADIVQLSDIHGPNVADVGRLYFLVGHRFGLGWLRSAAQRLVGGSHWQKLAINAATEDLHAHQRAFTHSVLRLSTALPADQALTSWEETHGADIARADALIAELRAAAGLDLSMLVVANRQLKSLADSG